MSFEVFMSDNQKYIVCRVTGQIGADTAREFGQAMDDLSRDRHVDRFLTDVRSALNVAGVLDNYLFAYRDMAELHFQRNVRSAILTTPGDSSHDFVETVARNAGYAVRIFDDEQAAVAWLEEGR